MPDAIDHVSALLARGEPPLTLQRRIAAVGSVTQKRALASNRTLAKEAWFELYRPGVPVEVAEALCWRKLDAEQLDHVVFEVRERRPKPLTALVVAHRAEALERLGKVDAEEFGRKVASMLVADGRLPADFEHRLAVRALWRDAVLAVLRDHRRFSDDEIVDVLGGRWAMPDMKTPVWPALIGVMVDRPGARDRLAGKVGRVRTLGNYLVYAGLEGQGQLDFVEAAAEHLANGYGYWATFLGELWHHPRTTEETAAAIRRLAEGRGALAGGRVEQLHEALEGWRDPVVPRGTDPVTTGDPGVHQALLDDAMAWAAAKAAGEDKGLSDVSLWALVLLAENPSLSPGARAQLVEVLNLEVVGEGLSGCAGPARTRAENPGFPLAPGRNYTTGAARRRRVRLEKRLGPTGGVIYHHRYSDEDAITIPLRDLADAMTATGAMDLLCHRFGEDLAKWETAFELIGVLASDFSADMGDVVGVTESILSAPDVSTV